jgi:hypothetical protein
MLVGNESMIELYFHVYGHRPHIDEWIQNTFSYPEFYVHDALDDLQPHIQAAVNTLSGQWFTSHTHVHETMSKIIDAQQVFQHMPVILSTLRQPFTIQREEYARMSFAHRHNMHGKYVGETFLVETFCTSSAFIYQRVTGSATIEGIANVAKIESAARKVENPTKKKGGKQSVLANFYVKIFLPNP